MLRWLIGIVVVVLVLGGGAYGYYRYSTMQTPPDARLACAYGAYKLSDGQTAVIAPSGDPKALRYVVMSGITGMLYPSGEATPPAQFTVNRGWDSTPIAGATAAIDCTGNTIKLDDDIVKATGTRIPLDITETTFVSHGLTLAGRLLLPQTSAPVPIAILVHGSEATSAIVTNRMQYLLPAHNIGVFVYDKRGTGSSEGTYTQDFDLLADDAAAALTQAKSLAGARASQMGFVGGSQAGWIEPLAAGKVKTDFVLVGFGMAESPLAEDREEVFDDLRSAGFTDPAIIAKAREITDATGVVVVSHFADGYDQLDAVRAKYGKEPWYEKIEGEWTGMLLRYPNWVSRIAGPMMEVGTPMGYDPVPALEAYRGPHLWILAGRDSSAPSENTLRILRQVQATHPQLDIVMFPTADHGMSEFIEKDGQRIDTRFSEGYFQLVVDWLQTKAATVKATGPVVYEGVAVPPEQPLPAPTPTPQ